MAIALFAPESFSLKSIVSELRREEVEVSPVDLTPRILASLRFEEQFESGVIVSPQHGVGEMTERVRQLLGSQASLILCIPQLSVNDRNFLFQCGASDIITPSSWQSEQIVERILAQLIYEEKTSPVKCGNIHGGTRVMRELYEDIQTIAKLSDPVLILGETGTGKELVAREIHRLSNRSGSLITINCAELSLELTSSDLFGHQKGSFTSAVQSRQGLLAEAGAGTVFLDEIGELDFQAQAKLLRVIEEKKVRPVGSNREEEIQARFVLATNRNLQEECEKGAFRADLFQRVKGFTLNLSPLRRRKADIPLLTAHFLREFNREYQQDLAILSGSLDSLFDYQWSGNVRELRAIIRKAAAFQKNGFLSAIHLQEATTQNTQTNRQPNLIEFDPQNDSWRDLLHRIQTAYFQAILMETGGNKELAAKLAGLSRSQFYKKLDEIKSGSSHLTDL